VRFAAVILGNLLFVLGLAGLVMAPGVYALVHHGAGTSLTTSLQSLQQIAAISREAGEPAPPAAPAEPVPAAELAAPAAPDLRQPDPDHVITGVRIPRTGLQAEGVLAKLVQANGGTTWEVPSFKAGHGDFTAGAGQKGNAVLMGHVSSINAGNVFKDLDRVKVGDAVEVDSAAGTFAYRVTQVLVVPRTDLSVVQPTDTPTLSLITCTGTWLPQINEFSERLVVRAELVNAPGA
jgi:sortase A